MGTEDTGGDVGMNDGEILGLKNDRTQDLQFAYRAQGLEGCWTLEVGMDCRHWKDGQPPFYLTS